MRRESTNPNTFHKVALNLNADIDQKTAIADLKKDNETKAREATKPAEIKKRLIRARTILRGLLFRKFSKTKKVVLDINFENMAATLELSVLPKEMIQTVMDQIVLSIPGLAKTETGYKISDFNLILENFGPEASRNRILKFFSNNPNQRFTHFEIAEKVDLSPDTTFAYLQDFLVEGRIRKTEHQNDSSIHRAARQTFVFVK